METFQATEQAKQFSESYARYIQGALEEHILKGVRSLEQTRLMSLGDFLHGNDGE